LKRAQIVKQEKAEDAEKRISSQILDWHLTLISAPSASSCAIKAVVPANGRAVFFVAIEIPT
jgi:hypothetical protein